ncbi:Stk1 family PASTA domain-containing Ser/Thr kinase [Oribacterium sp. WCC10]|uniref:Stk1 family PASTA domain-containing Ser/Thr kinase n=1 Tax=Oribacterium sp. WCC10 TaxID=1855343 RepID=UPI0008EBB799|nr:Stk1 family PASTA domain-containing Ser/Thr kinase [Oribacterium sp. WCC10]SFG56756.1 serine/threonine protein kinase [Oribacterium sp. WCC10]
MIVQEGHILDERYVIDSLIGQGGMSFVYRATDKKMGRSVAIKVLKEEYCEDEDFIHKFQNEAQAAAKLNHPNIVAVYDIVDNHKDKLHYIVMELVEGITLKTYIQRKGRMDSKEAIAIALQVVGGIEQAHKNGIVHRDIKPQNMIVSGDGTVKVADFGIARAATQQTVNTTVMGSVHYISPEQARSGKSDQRSDIYSFGCTLYEMLTGKVPYDGSTSVAVVFAHLENSIPRVKDLVPDVYPALDVIVFKCMQKRPERRYQHVDELREDLQKAVKDPRGSFFKGNIPEDLNETRVLSASELEDIKAMQKDSANNGSSSDDIDEHKLLNERTLLIYRIISIVCVIAILILVLVIGKSVISFFRHSDTTLETTVAATEQTETSEVSITISALETHLQGIIGLTVQEAEEELHEYNVHIVSVKEEYSDRYNEGVIISYPDKNYRTGDTIEVTVSKGAETIVFYDKNDPASFDELHSINIQDLENQLTDRGVKYKITETFSDTIPAGYVISTSRPDSSGTDTLEIVVSKGLNENAVTVPDLKGYSESDALTALSLLDLVSGDITYLPDNAVEKGNVIGQSLAAGSSVPKGTSVNLTVSAGPDGEVSVKSAESESSTRSSSSDDSAWYGSINTVVPIGTALEPGSSSTILISIRLRQDVNGEEHYKTLQSARSYAVGTELQVLFPNIKGESGIPYGVVEVVDASTDTVIASYECAFAPNK